MVRTGDEIILLHIPTLDPFKLPLTDDEKRQLRLTSKSLTYLNLSGYKILKDAAIRKIKSIVNLYSSIGFNIFVDKIPDFHDEANEALLNRFFQTSMECYQLSTEQEVVLPIHDYDFHSSFLKEEIKYNEDNKFTANKYKNYISKRIRLCIEEQVFNPTYLLIGSNDEYCHRILSGEAQNYKENQFRLWSELHQQDESSKTFLTSVPKASVGNFVHVEDDDTFKMLTIENIYCFSKNKIHLMEHLLLEVNQDKLKNCALSRCSFILSNMDKYA